MKKIYSFILITGALFAILPSAKAGEPPYTENNHIAYSKTVTGPVQGVYTIHLDTFVTGEKTVVETTNPADIVLVLDVSGSMSENLSSPIYSYTARDSQGYSYNGYGNSQYYYLHTDGEYYQVSRGYSGRNNRRRYYLRFRVGQSYYYLSGTGTVGTQPTDVSSDTNTIWTGVLYTRQTIANTKIEGLQAAVKDFITVVQNKALYDSKGNLLQNPVHNRIAIVKYAMNHYYGGVASTTVGNHFCNLDGSSEGAYAAASYWDEGRPYNCTEVVAGFTDVVDGVSSLTTAVDGLRAAGATAADYGMNLAKLLMESVESDPERNGSTRTVVFFTDGAPTYQSGFVTDVANATILNSKSIKDAGATIFSIGVFGNLESGVSMNDINTFMEYVSSDYPTALKMDDAGDGPGEKQDFYQNASNADLSSVFRAVAAATGGSEATQVTSTTATTVDVVSQSFQLPEGASADDIRVYFANCIGKDKDEYLVFDEENKIENPELDPEDVDNGHVTINYDEETQTITASGFDYSAHWCGIDESVEEGFHGMKLMIEIPIEMSDDAVGGVGVGTNGPGSGIWVDGVNLCPFETPHINLPTNLHIKKDGMGVGECATFEIYRKPLEPATSSWEDTPFKTVIVIGGLHDNTVKLMGLNPTYLYKIVEKADWNWSYDFYKVTDVDGTTISTVNEVTSDKLITNPFIFVNKSNDKGSSIRHAESAVYNNFGTGETQGVDSKSTTTSNSDSNNTK